MVKHHFETHYLAFKMKIHSAVNILTFWRIYYSVKQSRPDEVYSCIIAYVLNRKINLHDIVTKTHNFESFRIL